MALSAAARAALEQFKNQQNPTSGNSPANSASPSAPAAPESRGASAPTHSPAQTRPAGGPASGNMSGNMSGGMNSGGMNSGLNGRPSPLVMKGEESRAAMSEASNTIRMGGLFRPEQPRTLQESGVSYRVLESLLLKIIKQEGPQNEGQLAEVLKISVNVFRDILVSLNKRELLDTPTPLHYDLTTKGRELVAILEREDGYVGPAPVPFTAYCDMVRQQAKRERRVSMEEMEDVFRNYPMRPELKLTLKEGFNSQRVIIFYGPPGNGKSLITDNLHRLLREPVLVPYSFEFNGKVVQLYDPAFHNLREDLMKQEEKETAGSVSTAGKPDRRWLISEPPLVTVGTEFKVSQFDIAYDGQYFAPPHLKANNGIFILDDLGRQNEDHNTILNQFIYPLEQREAIIRFTGGSALRAPYLQRLFLSTNLNHEEILDDAFKRRLLYQVLVDRPTTKLWKEIFVNEAGKVGVEPYAAQELAENVVDWYKKDDRVFRACDPRNLMVMVDATLDAGQRAPDVLNETKMRDIYKRYPAAYKKDAKFYVGAMDFTGENDEE